MMQDTLWVQLALTIPCHFDSSCDDAIAKAVVFWTHLADDVADMSGILPSNKRSFEVLESESAIFFCRLSVLFATCLVLASLCPELLLPVSHSRQCYVFKSSYESLYYNYLLEVFSFTYAFSNK